MKKKLFYIDNIKVLMTILVVMHHTAVSYGAPGGWYYSEKSTETGAVIPMTMFVAINQSFFMGFFFLLAAYFTPASYARKGAGQFLSDRLLRLGVPLLFYSFIFSPFLSYLVYHFTKGFNGNYLEWLSVFDSWIDFGVLWFVAALLIFTGVYIVSRKGSSQQNEKHLPVPDTRKIILFALSIGLISFFVRIIFPVGWVLKPLGFQPGHFTQYISLFIVGLLAYKNQWFENLPYKTGKQMGLFAIILFFVLPVFFVINMKLKSPIAWFSGGTHWQSLLYSLWEQCMGISILTALLTIGKKYWNKTSNLLGRLSRSAFAVYIFHPVVVISLTLIFRNWAVDPGIKFLVVAPLAVIGSFLLGSLVLLIPGVKKVI